MRQKARSRLPAPAIQPASQQGPPSRHSLTCAHHDSGGGGQSQGAGAGDDHGCHGEEQGKEEAGVAGGQPAVGVPAHHTSCVPAWRQDAGGEEGLEIGRAGAQAAGCSRAVGEPNSRRLAAPAKAAAHQAAKVASAAATTRGTKTADTRSANAWMGALLICGGLGVIRERGSMCEGQAGR